MSFEKNNDLKSERVSNTQSQIKSTKIWGIPTLKEVFFVSLIWILFLPFFYLQENGILFAAGYVLLFFPVMGFSFFQEYEIVDSKLSYRPFIKVMFGMKPKVIDLTIPFKILEKKENTGIVSSESMVSSLGFVSVKNCYLCDNQDVPLVPIVGQAVSKLIPLLSSISAQKEFCKKE